MGWGGTHSGQWLVQVLLLPGSWALLLLARLLCTRASKGEQEQIGETLLETLPGPSRRSIQATMLKLLLLLLQ